MESNDVYQAESLKSPAVFVRDFERHLHSDGFVINNRENMNMAQSFASHEVTVGKGFDLYMIQVCKPVKAAQSLEKNPERAVLMPKFVMVFTKDGTTRIRFLQYNAADIGAIVDDAVFPASLAESYRNIINSIEQAL